MLHDLRDSLRTYVLPTFVIIIVPIAAYYAATWGLRNLVSSDAIYWRLEAGAFVEISMGVAVATVSSHAVSCLRWYSILYVAPACWGPGATGELFFIAVFSIICVIVLPSRIKACDANAHHLVISDFLSSWQSHRSIKKFALWVLSQPNLRRSTPNKAARLM